jgi:hypothetical protein
MHLRHDSGRCAKLGIIIQAVRAWEAEPCVSSLARAGARCEVDHHARQERGASNDIITHRTRQHHEILHKGSDAGVRDYFD